MIEETGVRAFSGVLKFDSIIEVRQYLKELLRSYEKEYDKSSNKVGLLLRAQGEKGMEVVMSEGWSRVGDMYVNTENSKKGKVEVLFQLVTDMKPRVKKTEEVLKGFDAVEALPIGENTDFLLYMRMGVPERLIVEPAEPKPEAYSFNGTYLTV